MFSYYSVEIADKYDQVEALSHALSELPHAHYETLKYLMGHLYRLVLTPQAHNHG